MRWRVGRRIVSSWGGFSSATCRGGNPRPGGRGGRCRCCRTGRLESGIEDVHWIVLWIVHGVVL